MEGLLVAEQLRRLAGSLPAARDRWSFPDERTAVLPLAGGQTITIRTLPPEPRLEVQGAQAERGEARSQFQRQLAARATGDLLAAEQRALDRVVYLRFAESRGFVPEPPTTLVVELTGRNANLVLLDEAGTIIGVERQVTAEENRFRELRPGVLYAPPPPYEKLDPRTAPRVELAGQLEGRRVRDVRSLVDGVGARLQQAIETLLSQRTGATPQDPLTGEDLGVALGVIGELVSAPSAVLAGIGPQAEPASSASERASKVLADARRVVTSRLKLARRRLGDAERSAEEDDEPRRLREEADLLLAAAASWNPTGSRATVPDLEGRTVELEVDPRRDAAGNAQLRYDRARRREARLRRALEQLPGLRSEVERLESLLGYLDGGDTATAACVLRELAEDDGGPGTKGSAAGNRSPSEKGGRGGRGAKGRTRGDVGVRFRDPRGLEVVVGRNARENDAVTFKVARSRDVWLHVQGYRGAHVVIRSGGGNVPFDSVLFAARLAAGFSEARGSSNVPVDYTERKNVWRVKGGAPGAVHYTQQKTVYVDPARDESAAASAGDGAKV